MQRHAFTFHLSPFTFHLGDAWESANRLVLPARQGWGTMSYILDALRRLEQDKELAKRGASPMEAVLVPDIEGVEEPERMRLWWVGAGVVLLVTVIALTYWITRHTLVPPTEHAREGTAPQLSSAQPGYDPSPLAPRGRRHPHPSSPFRRTGNERLPRRRG